MSPESLVPSRELDARSLDSARDDDVGVAPAACSVLGARGSGPRGFFPRKQSALAQGIFVEFIFQAITQQEAGIGGVADAELRDHLLVQSASGEVFTGAGAFGTAQAFLKEGDRTLMDVEQLSAKTGFLGFAGRRVARFGKGHAEFLRDQPNGFGESDVLDFLDEAENVPGNTAAEAVIELARGMDGERWRLFTVKWAEAGIVLCAGLLQLDVVADDADDVRLLFDRVREIAGVRHSVLRLRTSAFGSGL